VILALVKMPDDNPRKYQLHGRSAKDDEKAEIKQFENYVAAFMKRQIDEIQDPQGFQNLRAIPREDEK
jgi:hypothetical protein